MEKPHLRTYIVSIYNEVDYIAGVGRQRAHCRLGDQIFQFLWRKMKEEGNNQSFRGMLVSACSRWLILDVFLP